MACSHNKQLQRTALRAAGPPLRHPLRLRLPVNRREVRPYLRLMEAHVKALIAAAVVSVLLISACSKAPQERAPAQHEPSAVASPQPRPAPAMRGYRCESGETITATIQYRGQSHEMQIAVSGSGARYVGEDLEWWTKGSGAGAAGTLFRHLADGTSGEIIESCAES